MTVLITAASHPEAYRLQRIINTENVIFADHTDMPAIPGRKMIRIPHAGSPSFAHEMLAICLDHAVDRLFPLHIGEVRELTASRQLFAEYGVGICCPSTGWLSQNPPAFFHGEVVAVENGTLANERSAAPGLEGESGIFYRAVAGDQVQYSIYVVNDEIQGY